MTQSRTSAIGEARATVYLQSRVPPHHTIIEPIERRKDVPGWTTLYTDVEISSVTAATTKDILPDTKQPSEGPPPAVSRTEDILPNLPPAMVYLVIFLVTIVLSTAALLYFVNFGTPGAFLQGGYRKTANAFRRYWFRIKTLYRDIIFRVRNHTASDRPHYVRFEPVTEDDRELAEREIRDQTRPLSNNTHAKIGLDKIYDQSDQMKQDILHDTMPHSSTLAPRLKPVSSLSRRGISPDEPTEATSSGYETAHVYASPSMFRFPRSGTETQDFATRTADPANYLTIPTDHSFPRSSAPSPTSYSPTPSAIAAVNADPGSAASALAPSFYPSPSSGDFHASQQQHAVTTSPTSSSDLSTGKLRASIDRVALARQTPLPPSPPEAYRAFPMHRRRPTEEEWIEQRKRFEEEGEEGVVPSVEGVGSSGDEGVSYPVASSEEAAYWDVEALGSARVGGGEGRNARGEGEEEMLMGEGRDERLPSMSYQPEIHGANGGAGGVLGGVERAVDRVAGGMAKWIDGGAEQHGDKNETR
ncbi:hypothetical protein EV356DRAFT_88704 [Viridothelium virens]|uniref:Uncharacterized protein n=1 Tax=Viridothelium virens TaxID=1048519 RepID=A0A6A6HEI5_VIRVR|nr:hypothetical protein EV356DRAFT_88704 [Viridothelium virens]